MRAQTLSNSNNVRKQGPTYKTAISYPNNTTSGIYSIPLSASINDFLIVVSNGSSSVTSSQNPWFSIRSGTASAISGTTLVTDEAVIHIKQCESSDIGTSITVSSSAGVNFESIFYVFSNPNKSFNSNENLLNFITQNQQKTTSSVPEKQIFTPVTTIPLRTRTKTTFSGSKYLLIYSLTCNPIANSKAYITSDAQSTSTGFLSANGTSFNRGLAAIYEQNVKFYSSAYIPPEWFIIQTYPYPTQYEIPNKAAISSVSGAMATISFFLI